MYTGFNNSVKDVGSHVVGSMSKLHIGTVNVYDVFEHDFGEFHPFHNLLLAAILYDVHNTVGVHAPVLIHEGHIVIVLEVVQDYFRVVIKKVHLSKPNYIINFGIAIKDNCL